MPLVSILMTAYNRELYIAKAIESVLNSSFKDFELIIVDDFSTDSTVAVAKKYEAIDSRIQVFINAENLGDYANRNKAASLAKGIYLKYVDSDDIIYKHSLTIMVESMEAEPDAALGISFLIINDEKPYPIYYTAPEATRQEFLSKGFLGAGPSTAIIRRSCFEALGGFSGKPYVGDQELWLKLTAVYPVLKLQPALVWCRDHAVQEKKNEQRDISIMDVRYKLTLEALNNSSQFFSNKEFDFAISRLKRNHARKILKMLLNIQSLKQGMILFKMSELSFIELLQGFKPYLK